MLQNHFFCKFSKTSEKIAYLQKKKYTKILHTVRAVVMNVEKKVKRFKRKKPGRKFWEQTVMQVSMSDYFCDKAYTAK